MKLYSSDLQIMDVLWDRGELSAKEIAQILNKTKGPEFSVEKLRVVFMRF